MAQQVNIEEAIRIYYERLSLSGQDIKDIFGVKSSATVHRKKQEVLDYFADKDINPIHSINNKLDTCRAFEAWGLDIDDLVRRYRRLQKLGFVKEGQDVRS